MSGFYKIIPGKIQGIKANKPFSFDTILITRITIKIIIILSAILSTNYIFRRCISENTLENTIALGAIFATFGSAIVAVASLYCNNCYIRFSDDVTVLQNDLLQNDRWTRWAFIKRKSRKRLLDSGNLLKILSNAQIEFQLGSHCIEIPIPTVKADFDDLPILKFFCLMKKYGKQYETNLCNHAVADEANAFFIWDCIYDIYLHIVLYQLSNYLIWIGSSFVGISVFFSFFYIYI